MYLLSARVCDRDERNVAIGAIHPSSVATADYRRHQTEPLKLSVHSSYDLQLKQLRNFPLNHEIPPSSVDLAAKAADWSTCAISCHFHGKRYSMSRRESQREATRSENHSYPPGRRYYLRPIISRNAGTAPKLSAYNGTRPDVDDGRRRHGKFDPPPDPQSQPAEVQHRMLL